MSWLHSFSFHIAYLTCLTCSFGQPLNLTHRKHKFSCYIILISTNIFLINFATWFNKPLSCHSKLQHCWDKHHWLSSTTASLNHCRWSFRAQESGICHLRCLMLRGRQLKTWLMSQILPNVWVSDLKWNQYALKIKLCSWVVIVVAVKKRMCLLLLL